MRRRNIISTNSIACVVSSAIHFKFKNKAHYHCLTEKEVLAKLVEVFSTTRELDHYFNIHDH